MAFVSIDLSGWVDVKTDCGVVLASSRIRLQRLTSHVINVRDRGILLVSGVGNRLNNILITDVNTSALHTRLVRRVSGNRWTSDILKGLSCRWCPSCLACYQISRTSLSELDGLNIVIARLGAISVDVMDYLLDRRVLRYLLSAMVQVNNKSLSSVIVSVIITKLNGGKTIPS